MTVRQCPAFTSLKEHDLEKLDWTCQVMEEAVIKAYITDFNPDIKSRALKVCFKGEPAEIACQLEFKIE